MNIKRRKLWRSIAVTLVMCLLITSIPAMAFATETDGTVEETGPVKESVALDDVTEEDIIEEESTEYITTFDLGNEESEGVYKLSCSL